MAVECRRCGAIIVKSTWVEGAGHLCPHHVVDSLDAAWAEAEAALPDGWRLDVARNGDFATGYHAVAVGPYPDMPVESGHSFRSPTAALRALVLRLRERMPATMADNPE